MGTCWNCNTQLSLDKEQTKCDNCGEILFYNCNNCGKEFEVEDKKSKEKLRECKLCGYFYCPSWGVCSYTCKRFLWQKEILKILRQEIPINDYPKLPELANQIVRFLEGEKIGLERKSCPERNVPITYAKNRIKSLLAKFEGFRIKNQKDREAFLKRFDEITEKPLGIKLTVSESREEGSYGQEYRDAFNLAVCLGKFEIRRVKQKDKDKEYDVFIRCEKQPCKYLAREDLVITECPKCKKKFKRGTLVCDTCPPYEKGKDIGKQRKLKERLNNKDTCQVYRGSFKING